jgi:hypothetical protein
MLRLVTVPAFPAIQVYCLMTVNKKLGKVCKEAVAVNFNILYWQALRKITINLSKDGQYVSRNLNRSPSEYKSEALSLGPRLL